jgi:hypothetical protein
MKAKLKMKNEEWPKRRVVGKLLVLHSSFFIFHLIVGVLLACADDTSPRENFNAGTEKLRDKKLRDAEALLQGAVAGQDQRVQPAALYNLGSVRVAEGAEALKQGPAARPATARGISAAQQADEAARQAEDAVAANNLQNMVAAYVRGRGAQRELREAMKAVRRAMETHGTALAKWRRASGDFKSAVELNGRDDDAQFNADSTDRAIAALVDKLNQMQQAALMMASAGKKLNEQMQGLKGRIPAPNMPPGAPGDDDEEEAPSGFREGQQEGAPREGEEMRLSREEAEQLLDGFKLGDGKHLPMGGDKEGKPRDRNRPTW